MTNQRLRKAVTERPFRPFRLRMIDGRTFEVRHPEFTIVPPGERTFVLYEYDDRALRVLDTLHVQEIEYAMDPPADAPDPPDGFPADSEPAAA